LKRGLLALIARRAFLPKLCIGSSAFLHPFPTWTATLLRSANSKLSRADETFLDDLQRASFRFFWECADPDSGMVKDRSHADGNDNRNISSIAATGFGLTALCIADKRRWLGARALKERVRATLRFLRDRLPHNHGFFFHFIDWKTGERQWKCELSSIDTGLLLCGVLTARAHFTNDKEIQACATEIYDRVDWPWMKQGGPYLLHGWRPEAGFLNSKWDHYCEHMLLYLLAIGATRHPIPAEAWDAWSRPEYEYAGVRYINPPDPLFIHQYSHAWFDFRGQRDRYTDYFENSVRATRAHRAFCLNLKTEFPHFAEDLWGITASDFEKGYVAWGGPPRQGPLDGTLVPCAAGGSLVFEPSQCIRCLRNIRERYGTKVWKRFGFVDALNPMTNWFAPDVIGIDLGITLLMAENLRSEFVWRTFMKNKEAQRAMERVGFHR
jgi:hypothetical protein